MRGKVVRLAAAAEPFATGDKLTVSGKFNRVIAAAKSPAKPGSFAAFKRACHYSERDEGRL